MKETILIHIIIVVVGTCYVIGDSLAAETRNEVSMKSDRTIRVTEKEGIIPQTVTIKPGDTVKWVNLSRSEIEIHFLDEEVIDAADNPVYFFICRERTYESYSICAGSSASLRFQEKGSFGYLVKEQTHLVGNS